MLSEIFYDSIFNHSNYNCYSNTTKNDLIKYDDRYEILLEVPGIDKKDIKMNLEQRELNIEFEKKKGYEEKAILLFNSNRTVGKFKQSYAIPDDVDTKTITAVCENGLLIIKLPKNAEAKSMKIDIE